MTAPFKTRRTLFNEIQRDGLVGIFHRRISGCDDKKFSVDTIGDECFGAVDDDLVTLFFGGGGNTRKITAGTRFRHGDGGDDIARNTSREVFLFEGFRSKCADVRHHDIGVKCSGQTGVESVGEFFRNDDGIEKITAHTRICLGNVRAQETTLSHLTPDALGFNAVLFPLVDIRCHFLCHECFQPIPELFVCVRII